MDLKPLAAASCCLLVLSAVACEDARRLLSPPKEEEPWVQNVLAAEIRLPGTGQPMDVELSQLLERARAMPGIETAAVANFLPGSAATSLRNRYEVRREGATAPTMSLVQSISPDYFRTMEIHLLQGRFFTEGDLETSVSVAVVNETYAKKNWPGEDPLGKRLSIAAPLVTIVGIVRDGPNAESVPEIYIPYTQLGFYDQHTQSSSWFLLARTAEDPEAVAPAVQKVLGYEARSLREWLKSREPE